MSKKERLRAVETELRESIKITNEFLSSKIVHEALGYILKGYYTSDVAFNIEKLSRRLNQAQKKFSADSEAIIKKYTHHNEHGRPKRIMEPVVDAEGNPVMEPAFDEKGQIIPNAIGKQKETPVDFDWKLITETNEQGEEITTNGRELAEIEFATLGEKETELDVWKFYRRDFGDIKLTVPQWISLNPILADPYTDIEDVE